MAKLMMTGAMAALCLGGCAWPGPATWALPVPRAVSAPAAAQPTGVSRYRCEQGLAFTLRLSDDSAVLDAGAPRGSELLLRDAGGATPQQTVYSNARLRAEFGLGAGGREAMLRYASPPLAALCVQE